MAKPSHLEVTSPRLAVTNAWGIFSDELLGASVDHLREQDERLQLFFDQLAHDQVMCRGFDREALDNPVPKEKDQEAQDKAKYGGTWALNGDFDVKEPIGPGPEPSLGHLRANEEAAPQPIMSSWVACRVKKLSTQLMSSLSWAANLEEPERTSRLAAFIQDPIFVSAVVCAIVANTAYTTYSANYEMETLGQEHEYHQTVEAVFFAVFVLELVLKLFVHRLYFFVNEDWHWNCFDFLICATSACDVLGLALPVGGVSFARSLRVLRVAKILRVIRMLRFLREVRIMLICMMGSIVSLFWAFETWHEEMAPYLAANEAVDAPDKCPGGPEDPSELWACQRYYFRTIFSSMHVLGMASTGGKDWEEVWKLISPVGWDTAGAFLFYMVFFMFAVMNIITGVFEAMLEHMRQLRSDVEYLTAIMELIDKDQAQKFSELEAHSAHGHDLLALIEYSLRSIGVDMRMPERYFATLASLSDKKELSIKELVYKIVDMKGSLLDWCVFLATAAEEAQKRAAEAEAQREEIQRRKKELEDLEAARDDAARRSQQLREEQRQEVARAEEERSRLAEEAVLQEAELQRKRAELDGIEQQAARLAKERQEQEEQALLQASRHEEESRKRQEDLDRRKAELQQLEAEQEEAARLRLEEEKQREEELKMAQQALQAEREALQRQRQEQHEAEEKAASDRRTREEELADQQAHLEAQRKEVESCRQRGEAERDVQLQALQQHEAELKKHREELEQQRSEEEELRKAQAETFQLLDQELQDRALQISSSEEALASERQQILRSRGQLAMVQAHVVCLLGKVAGDGSSEKAMHLDASDEPEAELDVSGDTNEDGDEDMWNMDWSAVAAKRSEKSEGDGLVAQELSAN
eukprot:s554_g11.t2